MKKTLEAVMEKHGTDLTLMQEEGSKTIRGFFRAVNSKSWQSMESEATFLGEITRGQYVLLCPAASDIREGDSFQLGGRQYLIRRAESYYYGSQPLYQWGLCVEKGVNDTWGSPS